MYAPRNPDHGAGGDASTSELSRDLRRLLTAYHLEPLRVSITVLCSGFVTGRVIAAGVVTSLLLRQLTAAIERHGFYVRALEADADKFRTGSLVLIFGRDACASSTLDDGGHEEVAA